MAATEIIGSWFPSGYHGHFRSKSRLDFVCEYRQLAKPQPPKRFLNRSKQPTGRHVFSNHDNRESFLNDALYFEQGLGRKRNPNRAYSFKQDFITWMPEREYVNSTLRPLTSTYKNDFKKNGVPQIYVTKPKTSFDGVDTTSYRYAHGSETANPHRTVINAMNNDALNLSLLNRKNRAMSAKMPVRESVASCMFWHDSGKKDGQRPKTAYVQSSVPNNSTFNSQSSGSVNATHEPHPPPSQPMVQNGVPTSTQGSNGSSSPVRQVVQPPSPTKPEPKVVWQAQPQTITEPAATMPPQPKPTLAWSAPQPVPAEVTCA
ncbi:hypothetical protein FSP39_021933 [Pinctada imbricata]|uniref:Domain of unknown function with conserved HDNR motif domain-containing protein n=1 Tax=Pinctada imbricata TaxID=66713 RepID=A0AA88YED3_PINIB|nr:hypothetical protein FSP39_021933 [Pinctada imbricata]